MSNLIMLGPSRSPKQVFQITRVAKDLTSTAGVAGSFVGTANYMSPERALGKDLGSLGQFWKFEVILPGKDVNGYKWYIKLNGKQRKIGKY